MVKITSLMIAGYGWIQNTSTEYNNKMCHKNWQVYLNHYAKQIAIVLLSKFLVMWSNSFNCCLYSSASANRSLKILPLKNLCLKLDESSWSFHATLCSVVVPCAQYCLLVWISIIILEIVMNAVKAMISVWIYDKVTPEVGSDCRSIPPWVTRLQH